MRGSVFNMKTSIHRLVVLSSILTATVAASACSSSTTPAGSDAGTEQDSAVVDNDAAVPSDAAPTAALDGKYTISAWTCGQGGTTKDINAFALTLQIQRIDETFSGSKGSIDTIYPAGCVRTVPISSITYPSAGKITSTAGGARTCTSTCPANQCTAGTEADVTATYDIATSGSTATFTRLLDAAFFAAGVSLHSAAGCKTGDTETVTLTKN